MKNNKSIQHAWTMYDWANSAHSLTIVSTIFPIYFSKIAINTLDGKISLFGMQPISNSVLFSYCVSIAFLCLGFGSPIYTALSDTWGGKKKFMRFFCYLGSFSCMGLFFFTQDTIEISTLLFILSLVGWGGSIVFYNSYLPEIATKSQLDSLSAKGFMMGYVGSVLLLLFNLSMLLFPQFYGNISSEYASRISFLTVGLWWFGFSQITFAYLPNSNPKKTSPKMPFLQTIIHSFKPIKDVFKEVKNISSLFFYLLSFFVYNTGVQAVMYLGPLFGEKVLHMESSNLILTVLLLQILAIIGAFFFAKVSERFGNIFALCALLLIWIFICIGAYFVTTISIFYGLASTIGLVMGGIQSLSRSFYAKLIPKSFSTTSYFSLYDFSDKISTVLGTFIYGFIELLTGSMRNSVLGLTFVFALGFLLLLKVNKLLQLNTVKNKCN